MGSYDSYASMKAKLAPLGVYTQAPGSVTDRELRAYAEGIDTLFDALDIAERESFIETAETYGLSEREKFLEKEKPDLPVAERRALLLRFEQRLHQEGTAAAFTTFLHECGLTDVNLTEYTSRRLLVIRVGNTLDEGQKSMASKKIRQAVPAHLTINLIFADGTEEEF